jgi:hypothetical protein
MVEPFEASGIILGVESLPGCQLLHKLYSHQPDLQHYTAPIPAFSCGIMPVNEPGARPPAGNQTPLKAKYPQSILYQADPVVIRVYSITPSSLDLPLNPHRPETPIKKTSLRPLPPISLRSDAASRRPILS